MNIIIDTKTVHDTKSAMDGNISCLEPFSGGYSENQKTTQLKIQSKSIIQQPKKQTISKNKNSKPNMFDKEQKQYD